MLIIRGNLILILFWIAGTDSLRCPTCTYLTTDELVPNGVRRVLHTILTNLHQPECAQDLKETVPENCNDLLTANDKYILHICAKCFENPSQNACIKEEVCENISGQAPRCNYYNGSLTITFSTNHVSNVSIPLQMYYRGCLNKILAILPPDGCYHHKNLHGDEFVMTSLLENISQTAGKSMLAEFTGIQCLCSRSFCPRIQINPDSSASSTTGITTTMTTNITPRKTQATDTQPSAVKGSNYDITLIAFTAFLTGTFHIP